jgi:hypothetical protein
VGPVRLPKCCHGFPRVTSWLGPPHVRSVWHVVRARFRQVFKQHLGPRRNRRALLRSRSHVSPQLVSPRLASPRQTLQSHAQVPPIKSLPVKSRADRAAVRSVRLSDEPIPGHPWPGRGSRRLRAETRAGREVGLEAYPGRILGRPFDPNHPWPWRLLAAGPLTLTLPTQLRGFLAMARAASA